MKEFNELQEKDISISDTIIKSFHSLKGIKGKVWSLILCMIIITALLNLLTQYGLKIDPKNPPFYFNYIVLPIITNIIIAPFYAGAIMVCVKHLRQEPTTYQTGFSYFHLYFALGLTMAIIGFLGSLFIIVFNIPSLVALLGHHKAWIDILGGLYSLLIYTFFIIAIPLIADKQYRPLQALKTSFQRISRHWVKILMIILITYLIILLCTIPLLLGVLFQHNYLVILGGIILVILMIWVLPFLFMIQGMIYHKLYS